MSKPRKKVELEENILMMQNFMGSTNRDSNIDQSSASQQQGLLQTRRQDRRVPQINIGQQQKQKENTQNVNKKDPAQRKSKKKLSQKQNDVLSPLSKHRLSLKMEEEQMFSGQITSPNNQLQPNSNRFSRHLSTQRSDKSGFTPAQQVQKRGSQPRKRKSTNPRSRQMTQRSNQQDTEENQKNQENMLSIPIIEEGQKKGMSISPQPQDKNANNKSKVSAGKLQETELNENKILRNLYDTYYHLLSGKGVEQKQNQIVHSFFNPGDILRTSYLDERDLHMGDMVIQYPNPDHKEFAQQKEYVREQQVEQIFKRGFGHFDTSSVVQLQDHRIFYTAFMNSLKNLRYEVENTKVKQQEQGSQKLDTNRRQKLQAQSMQENKKFLKSGGGFFLQDKGGNNAISSLNSNISSVNQNWYKGQQQAKDFTTLTRYATWVKLVKAGFNLRNFLSSDGKSIFTVVYAQDENLKIAAENDKLQKCLNLELSDLLSLEPVDNTLRPLRMNDKLWHDDEDEEDEFEEKDEESDEEGEGEEGEEDGEDDDEEDDDNIEGEDYNNQGNNNNIDDTDQLMNNDDPFSNIQQYQSKDYDVGNMLMLGRKESQKQQQQQQDNVMGQSRQIKASRFQQQSQQMNQSRQQQQNNNINNINIMDQSSSNMMNSSKFSHLYVKKQGKNNNDNQENINNNQQQQEKKQQGTIQELPEENTPMQSRKVIGLQNRMSVSKQTSIIKQNSANITPFRTSTLKKLQTSKRLIEDMEDQPGLQKQHSSQIKDKEGEKDKDKQLVKKQSTFSKLKTMKKEMEKKVQEAKKKFNAYVQNDEKTKKEIKQKEEQDKAKKKIQQEKVSENFKKLRGKIVDLIQQIDFKRVFREANISQLNTQILDVGETKVVDGEFVPDEVWELYYEYLKIVNSRVQKLRKNYAFDNKLAQILNRQGQEGDRKKKKVQEKSIKVQQQSSSVFEKHFQMRKMQSQITSEQNNNIRSQSDSRASFSLTRSRGSKNIDDIMNQDLSEIRKNRSEPKYDGKKLQQFRSQVSNINVQDQENKQDLLLKSQQVQDNRPVLSSNRAGRRSIFFSQDNSMFNDNNNINNKGMPPPLSSFRQQQQQQQKDLSDMSNQEILLKVQQEQGQIASEQGQKEMFLMKSQNDRLQVQQQQYSRNTSNLYQSQMSKASSNRRDRRQKTKSKDMKQKKEQEKKEQEMELRKQAFQQMQDINLQKNTLMKMIHELKHDDFFTKQDADKEELRALYEQKYQNFRTILNLKSHKKLHTKYIRIRKKEEISYQYKVLLNRSLKFVNSDKVSKKIKRPLENLWNTLGIEPIEPFVDYFQTPKCISFKKQSKLESIWKNYQITENGRVSLFSSMERVKLVHKIVHFSANFQYLVENGLVEQVFALNDVYELFGQSLQPMFEPIFQPVKVGNFWKKAQDQRGNIFKDLRKLKTHEAKNQEQQQEEEDQDQDEQKNKKGSSMKQLFNKGGGEEKEIGDSNVLFQQLSYYEQTKRKIKKYEGPPLSKQQVKELLDEAKLEDFKKIQKSQYDDRKGFQKHFYNVQECDFVEKKLKNLEELWKFQLTKPWYIPIEAIRNYYGEKIALYFEFLGYYTKHLLVISVLGIAAWVIQAQYSNTSKEYVYTGMVFGFITTCWSSIMIFGWKRQEKIFSIKFGQGHISQQEDISDDLNERPGFEGKYRRSITNDNLNEMYYPPHLKFLRSLLVLLACSMVMALYFLIIILLFLFCSYLDEEINGFDDDYYEEKKRQYNYNEHLVQMELEKSTSLFRFPITIPAVFNVILLQIFQPFFSKLATKLTVYENHQSMQDYRDNYILKKFMFQFLSLSGPLFLIYYVNRLVGFHCVQDDCYIHSIYHFGTVFCMLFLLNFWEILYPWVKSKFLRYKKKIAGVAGVQVEEDEEEKEDKKKKKNSKDKDKKKKKIINTNNNNEDPFQKINQFIEDEAMKECYMESAEIYGTEEDYIEITLQYSLLILFGIAFPLGFFIAIVWNMLELQTDKVKLLKYIQRPTPMPEQTIGSWLQILEMAGYITIVSNSALIAYTANRLEEFPTNPFNIFLVLLIFNFVIKFIMDSTIGDIPEQIIQLSKRHNYLKESTIMEFKKQTDKKNTEHDEEDSDIQEDNQQDNNQQKGEKKLKIKSFKKSNKKNRIIYKLFGTELEEVEKQQEREEEGPLMEFFEDISTGSEVESEENEDEDSEIDMLEDDDDLEEENDQENDKLLNNQNKQDNKQLKKNNNIKKEEEEMLLKKKKLTKQEKKKQLQKDEKYRKKFERNKLWVDEKQYICQGYVQRPVIKRFLQDKEQWIAQQKHLQKLRQQMYNQGFQEEEILRREERKMRKTFLVPVKGVWFDGFRKKQCILSPEEVFEEMNKQKKKDQQAKKLIKKETKVEIDLNHMTKRMLHEYFMPLQTQVKTIDVQELRKQSWEQQLIQMQSVGLKRLFILKNPNETYAIPYCEDKILSQINLWEYQKDYLISKAYFQSENYIFRILGRVYETQNEERWLLARQDQRNAINNQVQFLVKTKIQQENVMHYSYLQKYETSFRKVSAQNQKHLCFMQNSFCLQKNLHQCFPGEGQNVLIQIYDEPYLCNLKDSFEYRTRNPKQKQLYSENEQLNIIQSIAFGLYQIHSNNLYHGNIHPRNIIITEDQQQRYRLMGYMNFYLYDSEENQVYVHRKQEKDQNYYIAPEIIQSINKLMDRKFNPQKSDMYSLGVLILDVYHLGNFSKFFDSQKVGMNWDRYFNIMQSHFEKQSVIMQKLFQISKMLIMEQEPKRRKSSKEVYQMIQDFHSQLVVESDEFIQKKRKENSLEQVIYTGQQVFPKAEININLRQYEQNIQFIQNDLRDSEVVENQFDFKKYLEEQRSGSGEEKFQNLNAQVDLSKKRKDESDQVYSQRMKRDSMHLYTNILQSNPLLQKKGRKPTIKMTKFHEKKLLVLKAISLFGEQNLSELQREFEKNKKLFDINFDLFEIMEFRLNQWNLPIVVAINQVQEEKQYQKYKEERFGTNVSIDESKQSSEQEGEDNNNQASQVQEQVSQDNSQYSESGTLVQVGNKTSRTNKSNKNNQTDFSIGKSVLPQNLLQSQNNLSQQQQDEETQLEEMKKKYYFDLPDGKEEIEEWMVKYFYIYIKAQTDYLLQQNLEDNKRVLEYMIQKLFRVYFKNIHMLGEEGEKNKQLFLNLMTFSLQMVVLYAKIQSDLGHLESSIQDLQNMLEYVYKSYDFFEIRKIDDQDFWVQELNMLICYNYIFLKQDSQAYSQMTNLAIQTTEQKKCIFRLKLLLVKQSFQCDLLLEREDDDKFKKEYQNFKESSSVIVVGNNLFSFYFDILETFLHLQEFDYDQDQVRNQIIDEINQWANLNNFDIRNPIKDYYQGLVQSKLQEHKINAIKSIIRCLKQFDYLEIDDPIYKKIFIPKIRLMENLFYKSKQGEDLSELFAKFEEIIHDKPCRPQESNYSVYEKFAQIYFTRNTQEDYKMAKGILDVMKQDIDRQIQQNSKAKKMKDAFQQYNSNLDSVLVEKKALIQNWKVWCHYFLGEFKQAEDELLSIFLQDQNSETSIMLCRFLILDYRYFGLFENAKNICKIVLNHYVQFDQEQNKREIQDLNILLAMLNLEEVYFITKENEAQFLPNEASQQYDIQKEQYPQLKIKQMELSMYAIDYVLKIKEKVDKQDMQNLTEILAYLYTKEGHPIKSYYYRRNLLEYKLLQVEKNKQDYFDNILYVQDKVFRSIQICNLLIQVGQYNEALKLSETVYGLCVSYPRQEHSFADTKKNQEILKKISNFSVYSQAVILEILARKGDFVSANEVYQVLKKHYHQLLERFHKVKKFGKDIQLKQVKLGFIIEGIMGIFHMLQYQSYKADQFFKIALQRYKEYQMLEQNYQTRLDEYYYRQELNEQGIKTLLETNKDIKIEQKLLSSQAQQQQKNNNEDDNNEFQENKQEKMLKHFLEQDFVGQLVDIQSWNYDISLSIAENKIFNSNNIIEEYYNIQQKGDEIAENMGYSSIYYAHYLRLRATVLYQILNQKLFPYLQTYQRKKLLDSKNGQSNKYIKEVQSSKQNLLQDIFDDSSKAKEMYKEFYRLKQEDNNGEKQQQENSNNFKDHPHLGWCHLILCEYYLENNLLFKAKKHLIKSETIFIECYGGIQHPNLVHLYMKKAQFVMAREKIKYDSIGKIVKIKKSSLNYLQKEIVIKKIIHEEPIVLKILDEFYTIGFEKFLVQNIKEKLGKQYPDIFLKRDYQQSTQRNNMKQTSRIQQKTYSALDLIKYLEKKGIAEEKDIQEVIKRCKNEIEIDEKLKLGNMYQQIAQEDDQNNELKLLQKAMGICNNLFGEDCINSLKTQLLEKIEIYKFQNLRRQSILQTNNLDEM